MNKTMLGIGAIALVAAIMIAASTISTDDLFAKKKYGQSNTQSSASANDCGAGADQFNAATNLCLNDPDQTQDSDGAATVSNPTQRSEANN